MEHWKGEGVKLPKLGFGTYKLVHQSAVHAVKAALELGFRHIDTAQIYGNEKEVGEGIRTSKVPREEVFLTTKIWLDSLTPEKVFKSAKKSLDLLSVDYVDLLLIHWPNAEVPLKETLFAMKELVAEKKTGFIGVSNFPIATLKEALSLVPSILTNQVEYHVLLAQEKLLKFMREKGMVLTAYSPLAKGEVLFLQQLKHIASQYKKSVAQIALKWLVEQEGVITLVKSSDIQRMKANLDIFDFQLKEEDRAKLNRLSRNKRRITNPPFSPQWDD